MIKILNVMTGGLNREGITTTQLEYMRNMDMTDIQMDIASVYDAPVDIMENFKACGCNVVRFPNRDKELLKYIVSLKKTIKKNKYDIIHVHGSSSMMVLELMIAKMNGVKVRIAHSRNTMCTNKNMDRIFRPFFYKSYTFALSCGKEAGEWLFPNRKFIIIHNGKDFTKFMYSEDVRNKMRDVNNIKDEFIIGFVGNIIYQKNPEFLIDVLDSYIEQNPKTLLFIIGDGDERDSIEQEVQKRGLKNHVIFTGRVNNVNEYLQMMDAMLLPSRYEGLPNVVLEWQIAGLPSLISNKVTAECKVSSLVTFLPIDQGIEKWVNNLEKSRMKQERKKQSIMACKKMGENKFDIKENVIYLRNMYFSLVNNTWEG